MVNRLLVSLLLFAVAGDGPRASDGAGARIFRDPAAGTLVIDLAPTDLPANTPHHMIAQPPVATLEIPQTGSIYGFRVGVVDSAGRWLPDELIHHFNLIDPDHRELFLPISRRLLAAGKETGRIHLPWMLFGERHDRELDGDELSWGAGAPGDGLHADRSAVAAVPDLPVADGCRLPGGR
jgi:hypothetical protein